MYCRGYSEFGRKIGKVSLKPTRHIFNPSIEEIKIPVQLLY